PPPRPRPADGAAPWPVLSGGLVRFRRGGPGGGPPASAGGRRGRPAGTAGHQRSGLPPQFPFVAGGLFRPVVSVLREDGVPGRGLPPASGLPVVGLPGGKVSLLLAVVRVGAGDAPDAVRATAAPGRVQLRGPTDERTHCPLPHLRPPDRAVSR